jgi:hypothetical protein
MKATDLLKMFPALQGKPLKVRIGGSEHLVTFKAVEDLRDRTNPVDAELTKNKVRVVCTDETVIWGGQIDRIDFV